jgi:sodium/potassium-transporting ATPase subunit alpha
MTKWPTGACAYSASPIATARLFELVLCYVFFYTPLAKIYYFAPMPWHVYLFAFHGTVLLFAFEETKKYYRRKGHALEILG